MVSSGCRVVVLARALLHSIGSMHRIRARVTGELFVAHLHWIAPSLVQIVESSCRVAARRVERLARCSSSGGGRA